MKRAAAGLEPWRRLLLCALPCLERLLASTAARDFDAVLLDLSPSGGKGLDDVKALRLAAPHLPLLVIVGDQDEELGHAALEMGAHEYLIVSDLVPRLLERGLRHASKLYALQRALQGERAASHASMTGLIEESADGSFRTLADAAPDPIVVHRGDLMVWANRAFARLLGTDPDDASRIANVSSWLAYEDNTGTEDAGAEVSTRPVAAVLQPCVGEAVRVEVRRYRILFDGAEATLSVVQDLAAREQRARARAQHERLASLGRLAANLGHEINNPLSYVVSNLSYLGSVLAEVGERAVSDPGLASAAVELQEARSAAGDALEGAERVAAIVRDVRVLSRIESRELTLLRVPDVLQSAIRIARGKLAEVAEVSLAFDDVPTVHGNDTALLQVFVNLLVNAADACAERASERHRVCVTCATDAEGRVVVEIRDTGAGISDQIRGHLFEPFFTTKAAGSGFGLAISYAIVESMNGKLTLENDAPHGAIARVSLPAAPRAGFGLRNRRGSSPRPSRPSGRAARDRGARAGSARGSAARAEPS